MDAFNENSNEQQAQQPIGCLHRFSKTIKVVIIGLLILLLMIPMFMIENLISERGRTQEEAIDEVSEKWSLAQTITGPYLNLQYPVVTENNGEKKVSIKDLILFPDELMVRFKQIAVLSNCNCSISILLFFNSSELNDPFNVSSD